MRIRRPSSRAAVALLLLALVAAPLAREALAAAVDSHACCPEDAPVADSSMPCQHVAALECCAQVGVPATPAGDGPRALATGMALVAFTPRLPPPPVVLLAQLRDTHGPPQAAQLRATVLRL